MGLANVLIFLRCFYGVGRTVSSLQSMRVAMNKTDDISKLHLAPAATAAHRRLESIDILRGLALFGVLAVNLVTEFRVSIFEQFLPQSSEPDLIDRIVIEFVRYALELKAFALFSFLFGVGLAMQFERLSATGHPLYWLTRRLLVLLAFGLIHLLLIWNGDILTEYAVAGLFVLPLLYASRRVLGLAASALLALYLALPALPLPVIWPSPAWITNHVEQANRIYQAGSWFQVMRFSMQELPSLLPLHVYIFPRTLGLFVLGMLAWRSGVFANPAEHKAKLLGLGCLLGAVGIAIPLISEHWILLNLAPVCLALGFAGVVLYAVEFNPARALLRPFTAIGRMAFTNYIAQSLIFGFLFFGYGLGQFDRLRPAPVFAFGIVVYIAQVQLSDVWLRHYRFGPIEWCWRTLMYGRRQSTKR
jgi:uncharacterized protein